MEPETKHMSSNLSEENVDQKTVDGFADEWSRFSQEALSDEELIEIFDDYFSMFPWHEISKDSVGADIGCGSGRWAKFVAPKVGRLYAVDASQRTLAVAKKNLEAFSNVEFFEASVSQMPIESNSLDFAYSLGVLHHVPDTQEAIRAVADKVRPGGYFLVYLYYAFDNRRQWYRAIWKISELFRYIVSKLPYRARYFSSQLIAMTIYWPLARIAKTLDAINCLPSSWPLAYYRDKAFYVMRTDALDRFGTRLEQRFTKNQIREMLQNAGFQDVTFSPNAPFWCALATKAK